MIDWISLLTLRMMTILRPSLYWSGAVVVLTAAVHRVV